MKSKYTIYLAILAVNTIIFSCKNILPKKSQNETSANTISGNSNTVESFPEEIAGKFFREDCYSAGAEYSPIKSYQVTYSFSATAFDKSIVYYDSTNCKSSAGKVPLSLVVFYSYKIIGTHILSGQDLDLNDLFKIDYQPTSMALLNYDNPTWSAFVTKPAGQNKFCTKPLTLTALNANKNLPVGQLNYLRETSCYQSRGILAKSASASSQYFYDIIAMDYYNKNNWLAVNGVVANSLLYFGMNTNALDMTSASKRPEQYYMRIAEYLD